MKSTLFTKKRVFSALAIVAVAPLALSACSGGGGGESGGDANTLTVLDYYNNEPDNTLVQEGLDKCAAEIGVTLEREVVPGADLMTKVLQQASSKTLPDVLMLDNPELQQVAATGALADLGQYGLTTDGFADGIAAAGSYEGKLYGLAPVVNTLAIFYNTDILAAAGVQPPTT